jgi:hypothetical protein
MDDTPNFYTTRQFRQRPLNGGAHDRFSYGKKAPVKNGRRQLAKSWEPD